MTGKADAQQTAKPPRSTRFDHAERVKIRAAILAYARENRIGAPNLQLRIADASKRSVDQIPLKTLQRFLKDEGRTNDGFLISLAEFVTAVGAANPHDMLAHDLGKFFSRDEADRAADTVPERLAGEYEVWAGGTKFNDIKVINKGRMVNPDVRHGHCRISGSGSALKVHETEIGPGSGGAEGTFRPPAHIGIMLFFDPLVFVLLRNSLTRLPRVYWLRELEGGSLAGHAVHAIPLESLGNHPPYSEMRNHELRPIAKATQ